MTSITELNFSHTTIKYKIRKMIPSDYMNLNKKYNKIAQNFHGFELSKKKKPLMENRKLTFK